MADDSHPAPSDGQISEGAGIDGAGHADHDPDFDHLPVMADEVLTLVAPLRAGTFLDATLGGGGHAGLILRHCPQLRVIGIDQDPAALEAASRRLVAFGGRFQFRRARFDELRAVLDGLEVRELSGFLFDLGVSSPQLDRADRGFSYRNDGPLDMRMDPSRPGSAADLVNQLDERSLASMLRRNADERFAGRIARAIVANRPFTTTTEFAAVVVDAIPAAARRTGGHPAKRTFQALRIEVNSELTILAPALEAAIDVLMPGGRGLVLTYHSGEDRIVKDVIRGRSTSNIPPGLPVPATEGPEFEVLRPFARRPTDAEQLRNRRASSARLRVVERVAA